jgi:hypothetical protein
VSNTEKRRRQENSEQQASAKESGDEESVATPVAELQPPPRGKDRKEDVGAAGGPATAPFE